MNDLQKAFFAIGIVTVVVILSGLLFISCYELKEFIERKIYDYKMKHRFDKPPIAKCWCNDCKYHGGRYPNSCRLFGDNRCTPPEGFCYEAEPLTYKEVKNKEQINDN